MKCFVQTCSRPFQIKQITQTDGIVGVDAIGRANGYTHLVYLELFAQIVEHLDRRKGSQLHFVLCYLRLEPIAQMMFMARIHVTLLHHICILVSLAQGQFKPIEHLAPRRDV